MTSKSITARENRRRQKLRALQPRFRGVKIHCSRSNERLVNGRWLPFCDTAYPLSGRRSRKDRERTVPADAFRWIPREKQCERCRSLSAIKEHGTHDHLMAVELLVAVMQRMWQARLEVGHRCYVALFMHENGVPAAYRRCTCGRFSYVDEATRSHTMAVFAGLTASEDAVLVSTAGRGSFTATVRMDWWEA